MDKLHSISFSRFLPLAVIYFFLNGLFLPEGLLYTVLLTPFFLYVSLKEKLLKPYTYFFALTVPFAFIHFFNGVDELYYLRSWILFFCSFSFAVVFYIFCTRTNGLPGVMRAILVINTLLIPVALIAFFLPELKTFFWYLVPISRDLPIIPRLKMLTYEASYYSLLLVPVFLYYFLKMIFYKGYPVFWLSLMLAVPLILSFSLGVIGGLAITLLLLYLLHLRQVVLNKRFRNSLLILAGISLSVLILLFFLFPDNPLFRRIQNIPAGADTSARGRTYEALQLAWLMLKEKSPWFGIGLGQIKLIGRDIIIQFYQYLHMPEVARLPNTVAETLAQYGILGILFRFGLQLFLFFKTKVWRNYYRLSLFIFIFIYQFTGSFMINIAELVPWILAFSPVVPELDKKQVQ